MEAQFESAVRQAAARPEVIAEVNRVYADLQARIEQRRPICVASGKCCHFEQYRHRLYVTTMDMAAFVAAVTKSGISPAEKWDGAGCPFQMGKLCRVHGFRPFGCRVFFCDPTATQWQQKQYESLHGELRNLHETMKVPYFYVEWRAGLAAVKLGGRGD